MEKINDKLERIRELASDEDWTAIRRLLTTIPSEDVADIIDILPSELGSTIFNLVEDDTKPDVLCELEERAEKHIVESLSNDELADIVEEMAPDDAADVLAELTKERSANVLDLIEEEESHDIRHLLRYEEDTAGGIMTTDVIALNAGLTVADAIAEVAFMDEDEPYYNAYVVDRHNILIGYIGLWELIKTRDREKTLGEVCHRKMVSATTDMDQEDVAKLMAKYDLTAISVVDADHKLVGRVTVDDVIDVIEEEASEDIFRLAGSDDSELHYSSPLQACKARLPWLLITLATGFITSSILKHFIADFSHVLALTFFVPVVTAMGGNAGIQSSTLIIRSIALGTTEGRSLFRMLTREITAGAIMGLCCGLIVGLWAQYLIRTESTGPALYSAAYLAFTVGLSMFAAMTFAVVFGALVPILLNRMEIDPAVSSGPFVTSSNDIFALLIYYGVSITMIIRLTGVTP
jgi:magnesium transporter